MRPDYCLSPVTPRTPYFEQQAIRPSLPTTNILSFKSSLVSLKGKEGGPLYPYKATLLELA